MAEREDQIELFYLPSYRPPRNPEERLKADLKPEMGKRVSVRTKARLRNAANEPMTTFEQSLERASPASKTVACAMRRDTSQGRSNKLLQSDARKLAFNLQLSKTPDPGVSNPRLRPVVVRCETVPLRLKRT